MEYKEDVLDLNKIRRSFYLSDNEKKLFDLSENLKINLALQLRSKRGSRKESLNCIKKDSKRILLLNERFKPFFVNVKLEDGRITIDSDIQPFLIEYVEKYPIIVDGYVLDDNDLIKCVISTGNDFEKISPAVIVRNRFVDSHPNIKETSKNISEVQDKFKQLESSGIPLDSVLSNDTIFSNGGKVR